MWLYGQNLVTLAFIWVKSLNINFTKFWQEKTFFEVCTWLKFKEPDMALEFNDNVEKGLTLKVKKFGGYQKSLFNKSQFFTVRHCTFH